jgi:SAM-dependent methyltransferase
MQETNRNGGGARVAAGPGPNMPYSCASSTVPSTPDYFEGRAGEYANIYAHHDSAWRRLYFGLKWYPLRETRRLVLAELGAVDGRRMLDLGCGVGAYAIELAARGARVTAVDVSPSMLAYGRQRAAEAGVSGRVEFVESDGLPWLAAAGPEMDIALAIGVFDYVDDPARWLAAFGRRSRTLIANFPRPSAFQSVVNWRYRQIGVSARVYSLEHVRGWLAAAGYDAVRVLSERFGSHLVLASRS